MKLTLVLLAVLVGCACAQKMGGHGEHKEKIKEAFKKCSTKIGVSREEVKKAKDQAEPDKKVKCFMACIFQERKMINEDGSVNQTKVDEVSARIDGEKGKNFKQCFANVNKGQDKCDAAYAVKRCLSEKGVMFGKGRGYKN